MRTNETTDKQQANQTIAFENLRRRLKSSQNQIHLLNAIIPNLLYFSLLFYLKFLSFQCLWYWIKFLQDWGDYTGMSQAVLSYTWFAGDVLLICWFGTQLTQHVRQNGFLLLLLTLLTHYFHNGHRASNQLRN